MQNSKVLAVKEAELAFQAAKNELETRKAALLDEVADQVREQLANKDYGAGTANVELEGYKIKVVIPKRVKWDEAKLAVIYQNIAASGQNPDEYIDLSYSIKETKYTAWPEFVQKGFEEARTVETGKPTLTIGE